VARCVGKRARALEVKREGFHKFAALCVYSTLKLMWEAAGSEASVAPYVLKTILLILKGKPGEMEETTLEKRQFSLDATNMMPVAVNNTRTVSCQCCFPDLNTLICAGLVHFLDIVFFHTSMHPTHIYCANARRPKI
jgi:hypothetical protein